MADDDQSAVAAATEVAATVVDAVVEAVGAASDAGAAAPAPAAGDRKRGKKEKKPKGPKPPQGPGKKGKGAKSAAAESRDVTFTGDKTVDFAEWYNAILQSAEVLDQRYPVKGMPVFTPYGFYMHDKIMRMVEDEWERLDHQKALFPLVIPETFLMKEKEHVAGFEAECFWVTRGGLRDLDVRLALRPTSETAMYHMFSLWIRSINDLPLKIHQTCNVFRHETKDTRPLIRVREIHWNEAHTAHATEAEALANLEEAWGGYNNVISDRLGVFGLRLRRPEWDKFAGAEHTDVMDALMPCGRCLQIVGAHYLGQKFAKVFDIKFLDDSNEWKHVWMTCYGVSTRVLASVIATHGDSKGLVLPPDVAQYHAVIVPIVMKKKDTRPVEAARRLKAELQAGGIRVKLDDRNVAPGGKFYFWEMKGVPIRVEIGPRDCDNGTARLVRRDTGEKTDVDQTNLVAAIRGQLEGLLANISAQSLAQFEASVTDCHSLDEVEAKMEKGGFARIPVCCVDKEGKEADEIVHEHGGGEIRGFKPDEAPPAEGTMCVCHGDRPAVVYGYVARSY